MEQTAAVGQSSAMRYESAEQWREEAMRRDNGVDAAESQRRREMVAAHHEGEGTRPDADRMADYELYILGKMELDEYEQYLLFKHGSGI